MLKKINQCDVYVGMWCVYMLQEVLYSPGIINQLLQLIMLVWSMIAVFKHLIQSTEHSPILKAVLLLIAMYTIYGLAHIMFDNPIKAQGQHVYLQNALKSLAPISLFYFYTKKGLLTSDRIRIYLPVLILTCILLYYRHENIMIMLTNKDEVTNNAGYFFVSLIPFLYFYSKKPVLQYIFLTIVLLYLFMAMKRGAILIGTVCSIVLLYTNVKNSSRGTKLLFVLLTIIILFGVSKYIDYMMSNSEYFMARVEQTLEGDSSDRDIIYSSLWNALLLESNPFYFYLGRGANSTLSIVGTFAHQDWLETFCNNGLIGVLIMFVFFYTLGKNVWRSKMYFSRMMFYSFATLFIIILSRTFFSAAIKDLELLESMLLGFFAFELYNLEQDDIDET